MKKVVGAIVLAAVGSAAGQTSPYFVLSGDQATFSVLQGGRFLRSWAVAPGTAQYQYPMAVNETIHTMGANEGDVGAEYDFFGADLGTRYTHPVGQDRCWDGTTDGEHFYAIDTAGTVARYEAGWTSPVILFDAGGIGALTYDPTNDSLWVSQFSGTNLDFLCFQDAFVAMDPYADCDGNTMFDIFDFLCFQDEFVKGCP